MNFFIFFIFTPGQFLFFSAFLTFFFISHGKFPMVLQCKQEEKKVSRKVLLSKHQADIVFDVWWNRLNPEQRSGNPGCIRAPFEDRSNFNECMPASPCHLGIFYHWSNISRQLLETCNCLISGGEGPRRQQHQPPAQMLPLAFIHLLSFSLFKHCACLCVWVSFLLGFDFLPPASCQSDAVPAPTSCCSSSGFHLRFILMFHFCVEICRHLTNGSFLFFMWLWFTPFFVSPRTQWVHVPLSTARFLSFHTIHLCSEHCFSLVGVY